MYRYFLKRILFQIEPEKAHHLVFSLLSILVALPFGKSILRLLFSPPDSKNNERIVFGLRFKNVVGLAAGFDKNAKHIDVLDCLGFGFVEIGTVTPLPQSGNPKPRLFRLKSDQALLNRMGFNNDGMEKIYQRLKNRKSGIIVGANIGKNKITPNEEAVSDYVKCFEKLFDVVDYFTVNVSSPNTPGLRALQEKEPLRNLLSELNRRNKLKLNPKPILLKIAPDLNSSQLLDIVEIVKSTGIQGVVATNTTLSREGLNEANRKLWESEGSGGISGAPLKRKSTEVIRFLKKESGGAFPIIGVGGIHTAEDAAEKLKSGAELLQLYTGWIYSGPTLVKEIVRINTRK